MSNMPPRDQQLDQLDLIMSDPAVDRILKKAAEFERMLNEVGGCSLKDRSALINELDHEWNDLGYMGMKVPVTGWLIFPKLVNQEDTNNDDGDLARYRREGDDSQYTIETSYYDAILMISKGFCCIPDHINLDDDVIERWRIGYDVALADETVPGTLREGAGLTHQVHFDFPRPSTEHIRNKLAYFYPELMDEIDTAVLNQPNEEEAFQALDRMTFGVADNDPDDAQMITDFSNYLTSIIPFDKEIPYQITFKGIIASLDDNGNGMPVDAEASGALITPRSVQLISFGKREKRTNDQIFVPSLEIDFHREDYDLPPQRMYIPASVVRRFVSIRRIVYGSAQ